MPLFEYECANGHKLLFFFKNEEVADKRIGCPIKECVVGSTNPEINNKLVKNDSFKFVSGNNVQIITEQTMANLVGVYA